MFAEHPSGLKLYRDLFNNEAQRPDDRLHIVCAQHDCLVGWHLTNCIYQLTELRDKLNETLASATRVTLSALNENTPISRLPSEIFLHIYELAYPSATHRSVFEAIALTHVCRRWRDALLSCPIIWSDISISRDSKLPLVEALLQRSRGVPLTVNVQLHSNHRVVDSCGCSRELEWEEGDRCLHIHKQTPPLDLLEPFTANIRTLNVRYLQSGGIADSIDDVLNTPLFYQWFPNLESLRWSCRRFGDGPPPFRLPQGLFQPLLPRLQRLEMINCWGLESVDTPVLKVVSIECTLPLAETSISSDEVIRWLRRRPSLVSLSLANVTITLGADNTINPLSMEYLKELTLRNVDSLVASRYLRCPSIGTATTLRIAPFTQWAWVDRLPVAITATDCSGGSVSSLMGLYDGLALERAWRELTTIVSHQVTTLEVEDFRWVLDCNAAALPNLASILPDLCTIRIQLEAVAEGCEALCRVLMVNRKIRRVERLVDKTEGPEDVRRNNERWEELGIEDQICSILA